MQSVATRYCGTTVLSITTSATWHAWATRTSFAVAPMLSVSTPSTLLATSRKALRPPFPVTNAMPHLPVYRKLQPGRTTGSGEVLTFSQGTPTRTLVCCLRSPLPVSYSYVLSCLLSRAYWLTVHVSVPPMTENMTVPFCLDTCEQAGYPVAGLEYGKDCWCASTMPTGTQASPNCNMGCSGDGAQ